MSTIETPPAPRRSRWRSFFVGSALVLAGVIVGVGTSAVSQGYRDYRDGWSDDGGRFDGPRRRDDGPRGGYDDRRGGYDGPRGWRDGPRGWFGHHRDGGGWHDGHGFGGGFGGLTPGRIERMVNRLGWAVDASSEQKQKLMAIVQRAADDLRPLREKRLEARKQLGEVLAAPQVDRGKLEALRVDHVRLAEQASQRITAAIAEAADVLTPTQRADLVRRLEQRFGRRG
jgi:periplasmic protein CpxP/Spy